MLTFANRICQDRICRYDTCRNYQSLQVAQIGDDSPYEQPNEKPSESHDREKNHKEGKPFGLDILFGQIGAIEENLNTDDDPREVESKGEECMHIMIEPLVGVDEVGA
jgi:hypothetical protein